jgi:heat shock protein HslJ
MKTLALITLLALTACKDDETISGQTSATDTWQLTQMNDVPIQTKITLTFPEKGRIAGRAPCNSYFASQTAPLPWFEATEIAATKMACPDLKLENTYFNALKAMTLIERTGDTLLLSNDVTQTLTFKLAN